MMDAYVYIVKVLFALLGIVAGMVLLYRYSERLKVRMKPRGMDYGLRKLDTIHLGYKKFVTVLEVKDHILVVGAGEKEMVLLTQWKKEEGAP
jgi:flagellar biogenesis protein FliO